jgi:hypothetical protein
VFENNAHRIGDGVARAKQHQISINQLFPPGAHAPNERKFDGWKPNQNFNHQFLWENGKRCETEFALIIGHFRIHFYGGKHYEIRK